MKRRSIVFIIGIIILIMTIFAAIVGIERVQQKNMERAGNIKDNLYGKIFVGENRTSRTVDKGGSIKLSAFTDTKVVCEFRNDGTLFVTTTESYCDGMGITVNGVFVYDEVETSEKEYQVGDVYISLTGVAHVEIDGHKCSLSVDENDNPLCVAVNGMLCEVE